MARAPDFFSKMERGDLDALEAFARDPGRSVDQVHEWLLVRGFTASRSAVGRWKQRFDETDRQSAASELADAIRTASVESGTVDVAGGVTLQIAQRLQSVLVRGGDDVSMNDLLKAAMAVNSISNAQGKLVELKRIGVEQLAQLKGESKKRAITPEEIDRLSQKLFG